MKAIRNETIGYDDVVSWFAEKEKALERLYETSLLPYKPDRQKIKALLLSCLEQHYGSLDKFVARNADHYHRFFDEVKALIDVYNT